LNKCKDALMQVFSLIMRISLFFGVLFSTYATVLSQEYVLESGDKISIQFWQDPNLNVDEVLINSEGIIVMPVAGRVTAAGLTVSQLETKILEKMNIFNSDLTQALVKILEYGSKRIFVTGAVAVPGPVTFAKMPNVWEAILQAGGALDNAQLTKVSIIRGSGPQGQTIPVNLTSYFDQNDLTKLPELRPNDNIHVPARAGAAAGSAVDFGRSGLFSSTNEVYIYGEVVRPGRYELQENMDVLQAFIMAGGPTTASAAGGSRGPAPTPDLKDVRVISHTPEGPVVYSVDLERYAKEAVPIPLMLRPGDTIFVPTTDTYSKFVISSVLKTLMSTAVSVLVSSVILNSIQN